MSDLDDNDLRELIKGLDEYLVNTMGAFGLTPTTLAAVVLSRLVTMSASFGNQESVLALLDLAKDTLSNSNIYGISETKN